MAVANLNLVCYCQARLTKYEKDIGEWRCQSCFRSFDVGTFYVCFVKKCTFRDMSGMHYMVCTQCANAIQPDDHKSDDDATETSTLFKKLSSTLNRIS